MEIKWDLKYFYFRFDKGWIQVEKQDKRVFYEIVFSLNNTTKLHEVMEGCERRGVWYGVKSDAEMVNI